MIQFIRRALQHVVRDSVCNALLSRFVTDHGKIIKTVNAESADSNKKVSSVVIEELDVLAKNEPIRSLEIVRTTPYGKFFLFYE